MQFPDRLVESALLNQHKLHRLAESTQFTDRNAVHFVELAQFADRDANITPQEWA